MERELASTALGIVTQRSDIEEFNLPSKTMNYMARGLPVFAVVNPRSECARLVLDSGAGWVADAGDLPSVGPLLKDVLENRAEIVDRGRRAHLFAQQHFDPAGIAERYEAALQGIVAGRRPDRRP
jgi:colanic acid biosynthesis glycosyl transferase WcaI